VCVLSSVNEVARYRTAAGGFFRTWAAASTETVEFLTVLLDVSPGLIRFRSMATSAASMPPVLVPQGISSTFAAQIGRVLFAGSLDADVVLLSDIDMLPLDPTYFTPWLPSERQIVVYRDVLRPAEEIPICYVAASPATWNMALGGDDPVGRLDAAWSLATKIGHRGIRGGARWTFDQEYLFELVAKWEAKGGDVVRLTDEVTGFSRLDRVSRLAVLMPVLALLFRYSDCHRSLPVGRWGRVLELAACRAVRERASHA